MSAPIIWTSTGSKLLQSTFRDKDDVAFAKITDVSQGEINLNPNPSSVIDTSGVTATGTATVTRVATGGPLDPAIPTAFRLDAGAVDDYVEFPFTVPDALANTKLKVEWFQEPESGAASGEWKVEVHDGSSEYSLSTDADGDTEIPALTGKFTTTFTTGAAGTGYKVRFVRATGANHLDVTSVIVGPGIQPQGAMVSGRTYFTPVVTDSAATISSISDEGSFFEQHGESMFLSVSCSFTTSGTTPTGIDVEIPNGLTVGGSNANRVQVIADCAALLSERYGAVAQCVQGFQTVGLSLNAGVTYASAGSGRALRFSMMIPIEDWVGSGTVSLIDNFASVDTRKLTLTSLGNAGTPSNLGEYRAYYGTTGWVYGTAISSTSVGKASGSNGSCFRIDSVGTTDGSVAHRIDLFIGKNMPSYKVHGFLEDDLTTAVRIDPIKYNETTAYGLQSFYDPNTGILTVSLQPQDSTTVTEIRPALSSTGNLGHSTAYFYVTTSSMAVPGVGFAEVQPGVASGLVSALGLKGRTDGLTVATGYVGEVKSFTTRSVSATTSGYAANASALTTLGPGFWLIFAKVSGTTAASLTGYSGVISSNTTADGSGEIGTGSNNAISDPNFGGSAAMTPIACNLPTDTPIYAKAKSYGANTTVTISGYAVRIV